MGNKNIVVAFLLFGLSFEVFAQGIPIQLMVVDGDGYEKVNHSVKLRLTLTNDTSNTTGQYQEVHITQTNDFGIVSASLGKGVATTNSSVYGIGQFAFSATEPMISIELDTSSSSTQYYTVGTIEYAYPMVSQRALKADSSAYSLNANNAEYSDTSEFARNTDSSAYSLNANNAEYSDTAEFARNFDESLDNDTSAENELQDLSYDQSTNTITISKGNSIQLKSNSNEEISGVLEEVSNQSNWSAYNWIAADSLYLYATSYLTNYNVLKKVLISNPDSVVSTINVGFPISKVFPSDSLVVGVNRTSPIYSIYSCGLDGSNVITKSLGSVAYYLNASTISNNESDVSFRVDPYQGSPYLMTWNMTSNSISARNSSIVRGLTKDYLFERAGSSSLGYSVKSVNRWDNSVFSFPDIGTPSYLGVDTSGTKILASYASGSSWYEGTTYGGSGFVYGGASKSYTEGPDGFGILKIEKSPATTQNSAYQTIDYSEYEKLFLINVNAIGEEENISRLILENWESTHPESNAGLSNIIFGHNEILMIWSGAKNILINDAYRTGSFIYRVPFNKDDF